MASVFDTIKLRAGDAQKSATWYRTQVNKIASGTTARQLFRQNKLNGRPSVGRLNLFGYNPKLRKTLPYYEHLKKQGACFGQVAGFEAPLWYAIDGEKPEFEFSFGYQNWYKSAKYETIDTRKNVGLFELTPF